MFTKHLAAALAALLAVAACAPCARAQSGRRLPRTTVDKGFVTLTGEKSDAAGGAGEGAQAVEVRGRRVEKFDLRDLNAGRSAPVVYAADGRAGGGAKVAYAALFGYLIFAAIMTARSNGYAPEGRGWPVRRAR